ncbi:hypothetical protein [Burkholderia gladioli]|uniref:hypothetical protein n=1 Tax=Burkholderia gladioli TaxID=28095 RepID=UPI0012D43895|nr:hypothetical protein [Burkholderia gladioli]
MNNPNKTIGCTMIFRPKSKKVPPASANARQPLNGADRLLSSPEPGSAIDDLSPEKQVKPKILLLDLDSDALAAVTSKWADVVFGTLGRRYEVQQASGYMPVVNHDFLTGHKECDIIVVDFKSREIDRGSPGLKHRPDDEEDLWASRSLGYIDNRGLTGLRERETFERIIRQGGIMVIFADYAPSHDAVMTSIGYGNQLNSGPKVNLNVWNLINPLEYLRVSNDHGSVMNGLDSSSLGRLVAKYLLGSEFTCCFNFRSSSDRWLPLATNKFQECVAAVLEKDDRPAVLIIPQLADKAGFLDELLTTVLPEYLPDLFPEIATGAWTRRPEYELPMITELRAKKTRIEEETRVAIALLDKQIEAEHAANGWIHDLITATGDELVNAVKRALAELGFSAVVDVDEIRDNARQSRREDLRIEDRKPVLVVDIKGIGGRPSDEDATQADKHAFIHAKESKNTEVQGLSIINHERHMPPLERDNAMPFRDEILSIAEETGLGLMTSFDLYQIVVNKRRWNWASSNVMPLLYGSKRIQVVPVHYEYIGTIARIWKNAFGVVIESGTVNVGDTLAIEGPIYFEELAIPSIRVNNAEVQSATIDDQAGFSRAECGTKLRERMRVFVVHRDGDASTTNA